MSNETGTKARRFPTRTSMLFYFLKGSGGFFAMAIFFSLAANLLNMILPEIISITVDSVFGDKEPELPAFAADLLARSGGVEWLRGHLYSIAVIIVAVAAATGLTRFLYRYSNAVGAEKLVRRMRESLFSHILHLPYAWHSENHTGDIIQRCTSDVEQVKSFLSDQLVNLFQMIGRIVLAMVFMFRISPSLAWVEAAFIPVVILYSYFFHHRMSSQFEKADAEEGKLSSIVQENLTGVRVVRAFGREAYEKERFEQQNTVYTRLWVHLIQLLSAFFSSSDVISYGQVLAALAYGAVLAVRGQLTAGDFIAFQSYVMMLMWPLRMLGRVISSLSRAGIAIDRLSYIMNSEPEQDDPLAVEAPMDRDIVFDHVSFAYSHSSSEALHDVSFTIPAGSSVGILGATGSGKSTLMYLLDRLYPLPQQGGRITIGGVDIQKIRAGWLRRNIGMVLQEPYLFSRTLEENIKIAVPQKTHQDVQNAARLASLDRAIESFSKGYETYVGERGVTLSGGQKQRTAIAQMLIRKPPVMVFDDSLSAVDAKTDSDIRKAIRENTGSSTVILIAHRITTLMDADQIIVMNKGRVVEQGTHRQLLQQNGMYKQIYDLQSRSMEEY